MVLGPKPPPSTSANLLPLTAGFLVSGPVAGFLSLRGPRSAPGSPS
jgi:hypothetical protein